MTAPTDAEIADLLRPLSMVQYANGPRLYPVSSVRLLLAGLFDPPLTEAEIDDWLKPVPTQHRKAPTSLMIREFDLKDLLAEILAAD